MRPHNDGGSCVRSFTALFACLMLAGAASAEGFIDLYTGGAFTEDDRVTGGFDVDFDESAVLGIRGGAWGDGRLPFLGAAIDISGFAPDIDNLPNDADLAVIPHSLLLMLRIPLLTSDEFPTGQLHPYGGVGPSLVVSAIDLDGPGGIEDAEVDLGLDVRGGIDVILTRHFGLFAEYRFTHFSPSFEDGGNRLSLDVDTHYVQGGVTFRFGGGRAARRAERRRDHHHHHHDDYY